jgi:hypothetical protein
MALCELGVVAPTLGPTLPHFLRTAYITALRTTPNPTVDELASFLHQQLGVRPQARKEQALDRMLGGHIRQGRMSVHAYHAFFTRMAHDAALPDQLHVKTFIMGLSDELQAQTQCDLAGQRFESVAAAAQHAFAHEQNLHLAFTGANKSSSRQTHPGARPRRPQVAVAHQQQALTASAADNGRQMPAARVAAAAGQAGGRGGAGDQRGGKRPADPHATHGRPPKQLSPGGAHGKQTHADKAQHARAEIDAGRGGNQCGFRNCPHLSFSEFIRRFDGGICFRCNQPTSSKGHEKGPKGMMCKNSEGPQARLQ